MSIQWPLVLFGLFAGCGGGLLAFTGLSIVLGFAEKCRNKVVVIALALLVVGGCFSVLHLGQPANIMAAAANVFGFSAISVELIMLGVNAILALVYLAVARGDSGIAQKVLAICFIVAGVVLPFVLGNGYVIEARPAWNTIILPLGYLFGGLAMGGTVFAVLDYAFDREDTRGIDLVSKITLAVLVVQTVVYIAYGAFSQLPADTIAPFAGALVVGCALPLVCVFFAKKSTACLYGAAAGAVVGCLAFRAMMWLAGSAYFDAFAIASAHLALGV